jgi:hypothetical protein
MTAPKDSPNNVTQRFVYDNDGEGDSNSTLLYQIDATGMVTQMNCERSANLPWRDSQWHVTAC